MTPHEYVHSKHCRECKSEYDRRYCLLNLERIKRQRSFYRSENKEKIIAKDRRYYSENSGKVKARTAKYAEFNKEKIRVIKRAYEVANATDIRMRRHGYYISNRAAHIERMKQYNALHPEVKRKAQKKHQQKNLVRYAKNARRYYYKNRFCTELVPTLESLYQLKTRIKLHEKR